MVGCATAVGEVIAFEELARVRRQRVARAVHARCCVLLAGTVAAMRATLADAPMPERPIRVARLRKLEELEAYVSALA